MDLIAIGVAIAIDSGEGANTVAMFVVVVVTKAHRLALAMLQHISLDALHLYYFYSAHQVRSLAESLFMQDRPPISASPGLSGLITPSHT